MIDLAIDPGARPASADQMRALALCVIRQGLLDLRDADPEVRADARVFFERTLWTTQVPWAQILELDRARFLSGVKRRARAEYLALPPPKLSPPRAPEPEAVTPEQEKPSPAVPVQSPGAPSNANAGDLALEPVALP